MRRMICPSRMDPVVTTELEPGHEILSPDVIRRLGILLRVTHLTLVPKRLTNKPATNGVQVEFRLLFSTDVLIVAAMVEERPT